MNKTCLSLPLLFFTIALTGCDYGIGLYVKNYEEQSVKVEVQYVNQKAFTPLDSTLKYSPQLVDFDELSVGSLDSSIPVFRTDSFGYVTRIPAHSTVYFPPTHLGFTVQYIVIDSKDTLHFEGPHPNHGEILMEKGLFKQDFNLGYSKFVLNLKIEALNDVKSFK